MKFKKGNKVGKQTWFKPGEDWQGNAEGRPKGSRNVANQLLELLETIDRKQAGKEGQASGFVPEPLRPVATQLIGMAFGKEFNGSSVTFEQCLKALREILDRVEGRAMQKTQFSGDDDNPVKLNVEWLGGKFTKQETE